MNKENLLIIPLIKLTLFTLLKITTVIDWILWWRFSDMNKNCKFSLCHPHCILETMPYLCHIHKFGYFFFYIRAYTVIVHVTKNTSDFYVIFVIIPGRRFPPNVGWRYVGWIKSINQELAYDCKKKKKIKTYGQSIRHGTITSIVHVNQAGSVCTFLKPT